MFEDFSSWQAQRSLRATGAAPATTTQVSKVQRLRGIAKMLGCETEQSLGTLKPTSEKCVQEASDEASQGTALRPLASDEGLPRSSVEERLGRLTGDRGAMLSLIDRMYANLAPGTVRTNLVALRHFGEYAVAKGWATSVAIEASDGPSAVQQRPITVYSAAEIELLLSVARARDLRYWMFLATIADTGRRVGEVLGLKWDDLRLESETPHFDLPTSKTKRQQYVPLGRRLREDVFAASNIERLKRKGNPKLKRSIAEYPFPYCYQTVTQRLRTVCDIANVQDRGYHCFRHSYATHALARGVPLQAVSSLLGHSALSTTDRLYHHATSLDYARFVD
jgi:integrase/recombinase XerD